MGLAIGAHCPLPLVQVNLSDNQLCGCYLKYGTFGPLEGTYSDVGIKAIAEALVTTSLTSIDLRANFMKDEGKALLRKAVEGRSGFSCCCKSVNP